MNNLKSAIGVASLMGLLVIVSSCGNSEPVTNTVVCTSNTPSFSSEVLPLINASCATSVSCHASGSTRGPGALTNYAQVFASRSQISSSVKSGRMPQGSTLSSDQKSKIVCWIEAGAANN